MKGIPSDKLLIGINMSQHIDIIGERYIKDLASSRISSVE